MPTANRRPCLFSVRVALVTLFSIASVFNSALAADTWTATGFMAAGRYAHTATLLPSGKVLVAGGFGSTGTLASAELYDPAAGTWSSTGSMTDRRWLQTATRLLNGNVLVVGGIPVSGYLASAEVYDSANGTWTATGTMAASRSGHAATLLANGKVLVAGGFGNGGLAAIAEIYDPATSAWAAAGTLAIGRWGHTATLLANGKVLVAGGYGPIGTGNDVLASAEVYDPDTGIWSATGSMTDTRYTHTATLLGSGKVLVAGGIDSSLTNLVVASAELYDPATGNWAGTGTMAGQRFAHSATLLANGKVLVAAGQVNAGLVSSAEVYDSTGTGTWTAAVSMTDARDYHTATLLAGGKVLVAGGTGVSVSSLASAELYQPALANDAPTADAGPGQSIHAGNAVNLNGGQSFDDNTPSASLGYAWIFVSKPMGSTATLVNANTATPTFVADKAGTYTVQLIVTDEGGLASAPAQVLISSINQPPTASAGSDQVALVNFPVYLNGSSSYDPDHDPITLSWAITTAPAGSIATINSPTAVMASFTPSVPGTYIVTLSVGDAYGPGTPDTVKITVDTANEQVTQDIACATSVIAGLTPSQVTSKGNKKDLLKLLGNAVADKRGEHEDADDDKDDRRETSESADHFNSRTAIRKLNSAINRTDGCALRGTPDVKGDGRDWITDCSAQTQVYACLRDAVRVLQLVQ
jgi:PKD repeat protein